MAGDDRPVGVETGLHVLVSVPTLPELRLPDAEPAVGGGVGDLSPIVAAVAADIGQGQIFGVGGGGQHLIGGVADGSVLTLALGAGWAGLVVSGNASTVVSGPSGHGPLLCSIRSEVRSDQRGGARLPIALQRSTVPGAR